MSTATLPGLDDEALQAARRGLVDRFGHKQETIAKWTASRVMAVYHARCREEAAALARADEAARAIDGERQAVPGLFRWAAADYLRDAKQQGRDALMLALSYSVCHLNDDEVTRFADHMAKKFNEGRPL